MHLSHPSILLAASLVTFGAMQAVAGELCKPALSLRDVRISEPRNSQRTWSGVLVADASPCSTTSGPFEIEFTRLKETAPDLRFTERFTWASGRSEVSIDMWWDEWFEDYRIAHIAACPCATSASALRLASADSPAPCEVLLHTCIRCLGVGSAAADHRAGEAA